MSPAGCRRRSRSTGAASRTARHASTHVSLRGRIAEGRHRLRACRGRSCSTSAPFVVTNGPIVGGCPVLPPDSPWNTDVSSAPLAADSAALVGAQAAGHDVHLDFGDTQSEYGIPYALVGPRQRRVPIAFGTDGADYGDESDHGPFPIPPTRADRGRAGRAARPAGGRPPRHRHPARALRGLRALQRRAARRRRFVAGLLVGALGPHAQRAPRRPAGPRPTRPGWPSSPGCCATTRPPRGPSATPCASRCRARAVPGRRRRATAAPRPTPPPRPTARAGG